MRLEQVLAGLRELPALRHLAQALGFTALWSEVPPLDEQGTRPHRTAPALVAVAQAGNFPWLAAEGSDAARLARYLGQRIAARGRVGGLFVLDSERRCLAVAVAFGSRPVLEVDLDAPDPAAVASLARLAVADRDTMPDGGVLGYAARAADARDVEAAAVLDAVTVLDPAVGSGAFR